MPFDVIRTTLGFEVARSMVGFPSNPVPYELTPDTAFDKGDMVKFTNGKVAKADSGDTSGILGVMAETIKQEDNPDEKTTYGLVYDDPLRVYRVSMEIDDDNKFEANGGASDGTTVTALGSNDTSNTWRGALLYVYEGTNKGSVRTVKQFGGDGTTETFTVEEPFPKQCDDTTKFIVLGDDDAADRPINVGTRVLLEDEAKVDANGNPTSGPLLVLAIYPADLMMDVIIRSGAHVSG